MVAERSVNLKVTDQEHSREQFTDFRSANAGISNDKHYNGVAVNPRFAEVRISVSNGP